MWDNKDCPTEKDRIDTRCSTLRQSVRAQGQECVNYHECVESETQSDSDNDGSDCRLFYGLKLRAKDPRHITDAVDSNRGDILLTLPQVRELILGKQQSEEGVATVWLTTAEMGFSLTDKPNEILCPKDIREGKDSDRFLTPAISRFVTSTLAGVGGSKVIPGSPLGHLWVPYFWSTSVGPHRKKKSRWVPEALW
jgi:hypothetical protein